jgi:hypothetical protein
MATYNLTYERNIYSGQVASGNYLFATDSASSANASTWKLTSNSNGTGIITNGVLTTSGNILTLSNAMGTIDSTTSIFTTGANPNTTTYTLTLNPTTTTSSGAVSNGNIMSINIIADTWALTTSGGSPISNGPLSGGATVKILSGNMGSFNGNTDVFTAGTAMSNVTIPGTRDVNIASGLVLTDASGNLFEVSKLRDVDGTGGITATTDANGKLTIDGSGTTPSFDNVDLTGNTTAETIAVSGALTSDTLSTSGAATLASASITGDAEIGGNQVVTGTLESGAATLASASVTGNGTVGGTLGVTGDTTLANVAVSGTASFASLGISNTYANGSIPPSAIVAKSILGWVSFS